MHDLSNKRRVLGALNNVRSIYRCFLSYRTVCFYIQESKVSSVVLSRNEGCSIKKEFTLLVLNEMRHFHHIKTERFSKNT